MTPAQKKPPTLHGAPVAPIMEIEEGEAIAGAWVSDTVPEIGFYKLLAKRRRDGTCEWVHFVQRADGRKEKFYRGRVDSESQLQAVVEAISRALNTAYGRGVNLHPADAEVMPVDGAWVGPDPGIVQ